MIALLRHKLRRVRLPSHGRLVFEVTVRNGAWERPSLLVVDSDDEREVFGEQ